MSVATLCNDTEGNRRRESGKAETSVGIALRSGYAQRMELDRTRTREMRIES
jgi:hypothetical protein